jgi:hypothetical protein
MTKHKLHYSGKGSTEFWNRVNALKGQDWDTAYELGCVLQDIEHRAVRVLEDAEAKTKGAKKK